MTSWADLDPSRVAVSGDWHANQHFAKRAIGYATEQGAEAILHVGDFAFDMRPKFLDAVQRALADTGLVLGWVDGNHDDHNHLRGLVAEHGVTAIPMRGNIHYLPRTYRWSWLGTRFLAMGGAHSVDRPWRRAGIEWWPGETISLAEAQKACDDGPADVMICHDVPAGVTIPGIEGNPCGFPVAELYAADLHRARLRGIVDQVMPRYLFAGHYHCRHVTRLDGTGYRTVVNILDSDSAAICDNTAIVDLAELRTQ